MINGPILQEKVNGFAIIMGKRNFVCSQAWIQRFRLFHGIVPWKCIGALASVSSIAIENGLQIVWIKLRENYSGDQIFNIDEARYFSRWHLTTHSNLEEGNVQIEDTSLGWSKYDGDKEEVDSYWLLTVWNFPTWYLIGIVQFAILPSFSFPYYK